MAKGTKYTVKVTTAEVRLSVWGEGPKEGRSIGCRIGIEITPVESQEIILGATDNASVKNVLALTGEMLEKMYGQAVDAIGKARYGISELMTYEQEGKTASDEVGLPAKELAGEDW